MCYEFFIIKHRNAFCKIDLLEKEEASQTLEMYCVPGHTWDTQRAERKDTFHKQSHTDKRLEKVEYIYLVWWTFDCLKRIYELLLQ